MSTSMDADAAYDLLDARHQDQWHVRAAECCWPFAGVSSTLGGVIVDAAADERARIVWWLRAGVSGPAGVNEDPAVLATITEMADVIEQHPERFADSPTGRST